MGKTHSVSTLIVLMTMAAGATPVRAQTPDAQDLKKEIEQLRKEFEEMRQAYTDRLAALETRLASLPAGQSAAEPAPPPVMSGTGAAASKVFNPDMAVIGNFLGAVSRNPIDPGKALTLDETEASFQAAVDPYARADFFLSFGESGVGVEEGYVTFPAVPGGLLVRAGKMRAAFGKVNMSHTHVLPWVDRPLVTRRLLADSDGLNDAGFSVARLIPNPWLFLEATGQVFRGDSGEVFQSNRQRDLSYVAHLRGYRDLTESTNLDFGASFSAGHNAAGVVDGADVGRFTTRLYGADATLRWKPLRRSIYHSFIGRAELVWSRRQQFGGAQPAFGYYVSGDYQLGRRWFTGVRFDRSGHADAASTIDTGQAVVVTYWPSEFSQIRGMYRRTRFDRQATANEFLFQFQFAIGAHGAHPF
jgi:hypothetical protein